MSGRDAFLRVPSPPAPPPRGEGSKASPSPSGRGVGERGGVGAQRPQPTSGRAKRGVGERERGAALITGLSILVVLTLLGIAAAFMADLEERMSGNRRDRALAFQAAEAALRDAERDIRESNRVSGLTSFTPDCANGLCYNGADGYGVNTPAGFGNPVWTTANILRAAPSVQYGTYTGAAQLGGNLFDQPRYLIEGFKKIVPGGGEAYYYRITARGVGAQRSITGGAVSEVILQEVFRPI